MSQMGSALTAQYLDTPLGQSSINRSIEILCRRRCGKAWPSGSRIKLRFGLEERGPTTRTPVHPGGFAIPIGAGKRHICQTAPRYAELVHRQFAAPLCLALQELAEPDRADAFAASIEERQCHERTRSILCRIWHSPLRPAQQSKPGCEDNRPDQGCPPRDKTLLDPSKLGRCRYFQ